MYRLVKVLKDGKYRDTAFIYGMTFIQGEYGWFPSITLLTLKGEKINGWGYSIHPYTLMLEYKENE